MKYSLILNGVEIESANSYRELYDTCIKMARALKLSAEFDTKQEVYQTEKYSAWYVWNCTNRDDELLLVKNK